LEYSKVQITPGKEEEEKRMEAWDFVGNFKKLVESRVGRPVSEHLRYGLLTIFAGGALLFVVSKE
jgi:hypothetical protein